ncbi:hypothetical protein PR048_019912 [Dryococelus australis]|uniref:Uncharacterized protein n=1 Tax=Dryococelus australis TaxID=614101 RepID=A0ABQ9H4T0_9NEOP|nr:hypothetical protein PR048_019912 [Dryococelus australis]
MNDKESKAYISAETKAKSNILQCISDRHIEYVRDTQTSREMFRCLGENLREEKYYIQEHIMKFYRLICDLEVWEQR